MKKLNVDFDEIQSAMEDISRDAFDYFLDLSTGEVIILSEQIIQKLLDTLEEHFEDDIGEYEEVEFDEEYSIPEWMEGEAEIAVEIFIEERDRYARIPERNSSNGFAAMREFTDGLKDGELKEELLHILDGKGAFRRFKDALEPFPVERKKWYRFNAMAARFEITEWLKTLDIEPV